MKTKKIEISEFYAKLEKEPVYLYELLSDIVFKFIDKENALMKHEDGRITEKKTAGSDVCTRALLQGSEITKEDFENYGKVPSQNQEKESPAKREAKNISIAEKRAYNQELFESYYSLDEMGEKLTGLMVNLAVNGKWSTWSDEQPIGTIFTFGGEALRNSGDKNIDLLIALRDKIEETQERLMKENRSLTQRVRKHEKNLAKLEEEKTRFEELMSRKKVKGKYTFTDEEMVFLAQYDMYNFQKKFPSEAYFYMEELDWLSTKKYFNENK